ncbi:MAG: DEAD/DEAH box helicase [Hyphomicrobiaceae bacterium]
MPFPPTHPALASALVARDYSEPTPVQVAVLEASAGAGDLLVSARTGSGKTVAFGLAMAPVLLGDAERFATTERPLALIIAPTRELALQVQRELVWLYAETGARIVTCVGGMDPRAEARELGAGAHIVVGTPGRLRDHLDRKRLDLGGLRTVVLDEADEMLDLGFREDLEHILDATPDTRQTLLFSATMPRAIVALARRYQTEAVRLDVASGEPQHADIEYHAVRVAPGDVEKAVVNILRFHEARAALVFCATRESVKRMHARLVERGFSAVALSGELTQNERTQALQSLRDGRARVLVATDVAARGLDLPDLALVVHAELPNDPETLLHRSGRTGRAGRKGLCMLVVPFTRHRKAEALLYAAKLRVRWGTAPAADEIRARDNERFLADVALTHVGTEEELTQARSLQEARTADEIALALVRLYRGRLPRAEQLSMEAPRQQEGRDSSKRYDRDRSRSLARAVSADGQQGAPEQADRAPRKPRTDSRPMSWFRLNIGRAQNADPRWLLPLICRAGNVTKSEVGAIRIFDNETRFEIVADVADAFAATAHSAKKKEGHISRVGADAPDDQVAVEAAIASIDAAPRPPRDRTPRPKGEHTSLPLAERLAAKRQKPSWKERKAGQRSDERPGQADVTGDPAASGTTGAPSDTAPQPPHDRMPRPKGVHTSLPLAERLAAERQKPSWKERKTRHRADAAAPGPSPSDGPVRQRDGRDSRDTHRNGSAHAPRPGGAHGAHGAKGRHFAKKRPRPAMASS